jgi:uncharacterized protein YjiK
VIRRVGFLGVLLAVQPFSAAAQTVGNPLERYVLTEPAAELRLAGRLREISGLAVTPDGRVFAHDDERAVIYQLDPRTGDLLKGFAMGDPVARGDFEGIEVVGDRFYLVSSTGTIYESPEGSDDDRLLFNTYGSVAGRACELEGLGFEPADATLLLLCKTSRDPAFTDFVTVFRWSPERGAAVDPPLRIPLTEVERATDQRGFAASGIARDPATGAYVIIAARDFAIVAVSPGGEVLGGARLDRDRHPQAEGIVFGADGSLLIADEGRDGRPRLTIYSAWP